MPANVYDVTGVVLAGGESRRMGRPKAGLDLGGRTLVERVIGRVAGLCREVIIVTRSTLDYIEYPYKVVRDLVPGQGPLGGLATGLFYARHPHTLVVACDLPFLSPPILEHLIQTALDLPDGPIAVVPRTPGGWHPLVAVYTAACLKPARRLLAQGGRKVDDLKRSGVQWRTVEEAELRLLDPDLISFTNVNTPQDLETARALLAAETSGVSTA